MISDHQLHLWSAVHAFVVQHWAQHSCTICADAAAMQSLRQCMLVMVIAPSQPQLHVRFEFSYQCKQTQILTFTELVSWHSQVSQLWCVVNAVSQILDTYYKANSQP